MQENFRHFCCVLAVYTKCRKISAIFAVCLLCTQSAVKFPPFLLCAVDAKCRKGFGIFLCAVDTKCFLFCAVTENPVFRSCIYCSHAASLLKGSEPTFVILPHMYL